MAKKNIGEQIANVRRSRGLSMDQVSALVLATRVKDERGETVTLSTSALSRLESGKWLPSLSTLRALSKAFDVFFIVTPTSVNLIEAPAGAEQLLAKEAR